MTNAMRTSYDERDEDVPNGCFQNNLKSFRLVWEHPQNGCVQDATSCHPNVRVMRPHLPSFHIPSAVERGIRVERRIRPLPFKMREEDIDQYAQPHKVYGRNGDYKDWPRTRPLGEMSIYGINKYFHRMGMRTDTDVNGKWEWLPRLDDVSAQRKKLAFHRHWTRWFECFCLPSRGIPFEEGSAPFELGQPIEQTHSDLKNSNHHTTTLWRHCGPTISASCRKIPSTNSSKYSSPPNILARRYLYFWTSFEMAPIT